MAMCTGSCEPSEMLFRLPPLFIFLCPRILQLGVQGSLLVYSNVWHEEVLQCLFAYHYPRHNFYSNKAVVNMLCW